MGPYAALLTLIAANLKQRRLAKCDDRGVVTLTELGERLVRTPENDIHQDCITWEVRGE